MKNVLALVALLGVVAFLAGCGGGSSAKPNVQGDPPVVGGQKVDTLKEPAKPNVVE